jgi:ribosomal protein S12 methylthiotransferase RimO
MAPEQRSVSLVTLGCARNDTDSEELAARLEDAGWEVAEGDSPDADVVVVNTCGFIDAAKRESVATVLKAAAAGKKVVATGCMAERYGRELAAALPEASAVLSFDDYPTISERLDDVLRGRTLIAHEPGDRRRLLPISPVERRASAAAIPGHAASEAAVAGGPRPLRKRLRGAAAAPLKLASGCDRRCTFCAIPTFRGSFVSRPPEELVAEAGWLAEQGVRELVLVSENTTSYGKDLGDLQALEKLLPRLAACVDRVRLNYLQPAELRPTLVSAIAETPGVAPYFDLSFQHARGSVLRRMRRFGDRRRFLELVENIRESVPEAGFRSNFIVGFPGETESDYEEVTAFVRAARLDAIGVFGYSDEDGTEARTLDGKLDAETIGDRADRLSAIAYEVMANRASARIGATLDVIMESDGHGWAAHQAPEIDGRVHLPAAEGLKAGDRRKAVATAVDGIDLVAEICE